MKRSLLFFAAIVLGFKAYGQETKSKLPLVYDPATKKYFIGGNTKFLLKESEENQLVDRIEVSVDGGEFKSYKDAIQFSKEGKHSLKFRAVTSLNNWSPVQYVEVFVDLTPPETKLKFPEEKFYKDSNNMYVAQNSPLTLSALDSLSGVASIEYSWDGTNFTDYTEPLVMSKLGKKTIYYRSKDRVGNLEAVRHADLIVDGIAPNSTLKLQNSSKTVMMENRTYVSDAVAFAIEAADDASQVRQVWVSMDDEAYTPYIKPIYFLQEGPHSLKYYSVDNVGNKEDEKSIQLYSVSAPPKTTAHIAGKVVNTGGINYATRTFTFTIDGKNNAVGMDHIEVKLDQEQEFKPYVEAIRFKTAGLHTINYRAVDRVGNYEAAKMYNVNISDVAPETSFSTAQPLVQKNGATYSPSPNILTFSVSNSPVGVDKTLVSINDAPFVPYSGPLTLQNDHKLYKIVYKSQDKLGNEEAPKTVAIHMVGAVPILDLFISNGQSTEEQVRTDYLEQAAPTAASKPVAAPAPRNPSSANNAALDKASTKP